MTDDIRGIVPPAKTAEEFAARQTWQYRVVAATGARTTKLGAIMLAILGKSRATRSFGDTAMITASGNVATRFVNRDGVGSIVSIGKVQEFTDSLSGLADHLQLNDEDRIALFAKARAWISKDARTIKEDLHFTKTR